MISCVTSKRHLDIGKDEVISTNHIDLYGRVRSKRRREVSVAGNGDWAANPEAIRQLGHSAFVH
jgi:hypothetical protein